MTANDQAGPIKSKITAYLQYRVFTVQGYCSILDANLLCEIIVHQINSDVAGALIEIGVWHGKSFFILALGRSQSEKCLAIDLFATRPLAAGERQQRDEFNRNADRLKIALSDSEVLQCDSALVTPTQVLNLVGKARLVHVDGAHDYAHARSDLELATNVLAERGTVVIDDPFNHQWPEVGAATFDWLRGNPDFLPWAATPQKLFVCRRVHVKLYENLLRNEFRRELSRRIEAFGTQYISLRSVTSQIIRERLMIKLITPRQVKYPRPT